ncbi:MULTISPECIES: HlyD family secretion protein [Thioclava]|uniref:HlyD family secretion protein n=1 Tax=Thioclava litoralis TaxID=3076557 RepID=A0ABZ1E0F9_9RHOB|nr:HlyD family secretion protein [Thioclava sp. FTW29]
MSSDPKSAPDSAANSGTPKSGNRKKKILTGVAVVAILAGGWFGISWWTHGRFMVKTDDAYVQADVSLMSSKLQGYISEIPVQDNQHVHKGDVLLRIDEGDYKIALELAQSKLPTLERTLARIDTQIAAAETAVTQAKAQLAASDAALSNAQTNAKRAKDLAARRVTSQADLDTANETLATAQANRTAAVAAIAGAEADVDVLRAERAESDSSRKELELAVAQAQRDLDHTVLRAPFDGVVANIAIKQGELVSIGETLAAVVPDHGLYVEANLKETQLAGIAPGAKARVVLDTDKDHPLEGVVSSVAPATGAIFSLLPADNATGNFTKIVQRVPVRITLPEDDHERLRAGLSAVIEIDRRTSPEPGATDTASAQ